MMKSLVTAEFLRLRRRTNVWLVLAAPAVFTAAVYALGLSSAVASLDHAARPLSPDEAASLFASRLAPFAFPLSITSALQNGMILVMALGAYITGATVSAEFSWGTLKTSLLARHARGEFVIVRIAAMAAITLAMVATVALLGMILPLGAAVLGVELPNVTGARPTAPAGAFVGVSLLGLLVVSLTTLEALVTKSGGIPLLLVGAQFAAEAVIRGARDDLGPSAWILTQFLPFTSARLVVDRAAADSVPLMTLQAVSEGPPTPMLVAAALLWVLLFTAMACRILLHVDISE